MKADTMNAKIASSSDVLAWSSSSEIEIDGRASAMLAALKALGREPTCLSLVFLGRCRTIRCPALSTVATVETL